MIESKTIEDSFKFYRQTTKDYALPMKTYRKIINGFILFIMRKVFEGFDVQLSGGRSLGAIAVRGRQTNPRVDESGKIKGVGPDWGTTRKLWTEKATELGLTLKEYIATVPKEQREIIYHLNEHSNGIRYKLVWIKHKMNLPHKSFFTLQFYRRNKRTVPIMVRQGKEYLVIN